MRQKDIERLAAAAYEVADPTGPIPFRTVLRLRTLLGEIDPYGLLRPGQPVPANLDETQELSLRESPRIGPRGRRERSGRPGFPS